jgi:GxxExxY protein
METARLRSESRRSWDDSCGREVGCELPCEIKEFLTTKETKYTKREPYAYGRGGKMAEIVYKDESYRIMGACFEVYKNMGPGFLEAVYQECLEIELTDRAIPFAAQQLIPISYKGRKLLQTYRADLLCYGTIIIEVKAQSALSDTHRAQVFNYLRASGMRLGLLVNFSSSSELEYERIVL